MTEITTLYKIQKDFEGDFPFGVFDIETDGLNAKKFVFGVVKVDGVHYTFTDKTEMLDFMLKFEGYSFFAHNSEYDLSGLFENIISDLNYPDDRILYSGSNLIMLQKCTYSYYNKKTRKTQRKFVSFFDSLNYFKINLAGLGQGIGLKKLVDIVDYEHLKFNPQTEYYCKRDCDILEKALNMFFDLLQNRFHIKPRITIASNALAVFRKNYLDKNTPINIELDNYFQLSYFGGRTEVFKKEMGAGVCYDVNSLYPSVMAEGYRYPNPSKLKEAEGKETLLGLLKFKKYEGVAFIKMKTDLNIPLLPVKREGKLLFPAGIIEGWYNFPELRKALQVGYELIEAGKIVYSLGIKSPFREYVKDLYAYRKELKEAKNPMQIFVKYLLNSLYGKFGQQNEEKEIGAGSDIKNHIGESFEEFPNSPGVGYWKKLDENGEVKRTRANHSIFAWCSYVTSYARVKLYNFMEACNFNIAYCDTDSLFTPEILEDSKELGDMGLEYKFKDAQFIKPKHYHVTKYGKYEGAGFVTYDSVNKLKGVRGVNDVFAETQTLTKVVKNKEALRIKRPNPETGKPFRPGESVTIIKTIQMDDNKRQWAGKESKPLIMD